MYTKRSAVADKRKFPIAAGRRNSRSRAAGRLGDRRVAGDEGYAQRRASNRSEERRAMALALQTAARFAVWITTPSFSLSAQFCVPLFFSAQFCAPREAPVERFLLSRRE